MLIGILAPEEAPEEAPKAPPKEAQREADAGQLDRMAQEVEECGDRLAAFGAEAARLSAQILDEGSTTAARCRAVARGLRHLEGVEEKVRPACYELSLVLSPELAPFVKKATLSAQETWNYCRAEGLL